MNIFCLFPRIRRKEENSGGNIGKDGGAGNANWGNACVPAELKSELNILLLGQKRQERHDCGCTC